MGQFAEMSAEIGVDPKIVHAYKAMRAHVKIRPSGHRGSRRRTRDALVTPITIFSTTCVEKKRYQADELEKRPQRQLHTRRWQLKQAERGQARGELSLPRRAMCAHDGSARPCQSLSQHQDPRLHQGQGASTSVSSSASKIVSTSAMSK